MRILTVSNCRLTLHEGSGQVVLSFSQGLRDAGHTVDTFGPESYAFAGWMEPRARSARQVIGMLKFVLQKLKREKYDIIEIYGGEGWATFLWIKRFIVGRPMLVFHSNGVEPHVESVFRGIDMTGHPWWHIDQTAMMRRGFSAADYLVTVGNYDRDFVIREELLPPARVLTIHPGLNPVFLDQPIVEKKEQVIGFCGTWMPRKGSSVIASALPHVLRAHVSAKLLLVGVGKQFRKEEWFPADVCSQIDVVPFVYDKSQLLDCYKRMQVSLMPSHYESFGLVAVEAMAGGVALVANKTGIVAELTHGKEAWILEDNSADNLTAALLHLLANDDLRRDIAYLGWKFAQHLTWENASTQLESQYSTWLRGFNGNS
jgi:glycosyltransferase involved in cell wall biosynthesis